MHLGHMFNGIIKLFKKIFITKNRIIIPLKFQHSPLPKKKLLFEFFWGDKEEFLVIWVGPILIDQCPLNARCSQKTRGVLSHRGLAIYLWRKVVCFVLFCFVVMRSTELWYASDPPFSLSLEHSSSEGVHDGLGSMTFGLVVQKFLNIEWFLH